MEEFGVYSEVGKLRKVIVHRPELSLKRLTPSNHDDLLFDDVLWVERAQWEHDQFVAAMRARGVQVFYLLDLLGEALAASEARLDATRLGHEVGHRTLLDVLNAENDAAAARLALAQARTGLLLDRLRLAALAGQLDEDTLHSANQVLTRAP